MIGEPALNILVVDDDDVAAEAILRGLHKHATDFPVVVAEDGLVALQILRGEHPTRRIGKSHIILLDLNMPRMSGLEFLRSLRSDTHLRGTVVFVLTTTGSDADRRDAFQECIAGYMVKSGLGPQLSGLAHFLISYRAVMQPP